MSEYLRTFAAHHRPTHDAHSLFLDAMGRHHHLTGSQPSIAFREILQEVAADDDALRGLSTEAALDYVYQHGFARWQEQVAAGQTGQMGRSGPMTRREASDAVDADPKWKADRAALGDFFIHVTTGEKLTHAQLHERSRNADGSYNPGFNSGFVNIVAHEYRKRVDALMAGQEPPAVPQAASPVVPAPPSVEPARPASGVSPDMSLAAARALSDLPPPPKTEAPAAPVSREPSQADIAASWDRTVQRTTADMQAALSTKPLERFVPGPGYAHDAGQDEAASVRQEAADPAKVSAGWGKAITSIASTMPTRSETTKASADDPGAAKAGWDAAIAKVSTGNRI